MDGKSKVNNWTTDDAMLAFKRRCLGEEKVIAMLVEIQITVG